MTAQQRIQQAKDNRLTQLDLSDCGLMEIPQEVFELTQLQTLLLGKNYLPNEDLIHRNRIDFIPLEITFLKNLKGLGLAFNDFSEFPMVVSSLPRLQTLMINNNQLSNLPSEIGQLKQLQILGLNNNLLVDLPLEIGNLRKLKILGLANNQLTALPDSFIRFQHLEQLGLSANQFTEVPPVIFELEELQVVGLANNEIHSFANEWMRLKRLQRLDLKGNPLSQKLMDIAAKGHSAIQYFFSQQATQRKRLLQSIIDGKKEAVERTKLKDKFFRLFHSSTTICSVCDGAKKVNGYIGHLNMRFNNEKCFGCDGQGVANEETDELHKILATCNQKKERCRNLIITLVEDEAAFSQKIQANRANTQILFEQTVNSIRDILKDKNRQIDIRVRQFSSYQIFEQKILIALYNLYLYQVTEQERFDKGDYSLDFGNAPVNVFNISRVVETILSEQETLFDALMETTSEDSVNDINDRLEELMDELKVLK
jgi:Leucine-rich repeat (LRR) protein